MIVFAVGREGRVRTIAVFDIGVGPIAAIGSGLYRYLRRRTVPVSVESSQPVFLVEFTEGRHIADVLEGRPVSRRRGRRSGLWRFCRLPGRNSGVDGGEN